MKVQIDEPTDDELDALDALALEHADTERGPLLDKAARALRSCRAAVDTVRKILTVPVPVGSGEARLSRDLWEVIGN